MTDVEHAKHFTEIFTRILSIASCVSARERVEIYRKNFLGDHTFVTVHGGQTDGLEREVPLTTSSFVGTKDHYAAIMLTLEPN